MSQVTIFDVENIFETLYGYKPMKIPGLPATTDQGNSFKLDTPNTRKQTAAGTAIYGGKDMIGREVFLPITIQYGKNKYEFPYSVVSLHSKKTIVETPMVERRGSVKELISTEDWKINIKGFLIDPLNQFPDDQLSALNKLFSINAPVQLRCALTDLFLIDDDSVIITDLNIPDSSGVVGVRSFTMAMVTDNILTLTLDPFQSDENVMIDGVSTLTGQGTSSRMV